MNRRSALLALCLLGAASARPNPDRLGICYVFAAGKLSLRAPCVVSPGYGAGAQYVALTIGTRQYNLEFPNLKPDQPPTLDGRAALAYRRDASFLAVLKGKPEEGEEYVDCVKTRDGRTDLCYYVP
jgi:hypothetical protein